MIDIPESQMPLLVDNPDPEELVLNEEMTIAAAALALLGSKRRLSDGETRLCKVGFSQSPHGQRLHGTRRTRKPGRRQVCPA